MVLFIKKIKKLLGGNPVVVEIISLFLMVGVIYFGFKGVMVLGFQTSSPMVAVTLDSMTHPDDSWDEYYVNRGCDVSDFPFQGGLQPGDLVILNGVGSPGDIEVGDVIVWERKASKGRSKIIHRVAIKDNDSEGPYLRTRSDKYQRNDSQKIRLDDIMGKAVFSLPYLGYPSTWV